MKKQTILILGFLLILAIGGWFWYGRQYKKMAQIEQKQSEIATQTKVEIEGYQTYKNQEYGFAMQIPSNWEVTSRPLDETVVNEMAFCLAPKGRGDVETIFGADGTSCSVAITATRMPIAGYADNSPKIDRVVIFPDIQATMFNDVDVEFKYQNLFWTISMTYSDTPPLNNKDVFFNIIHSLRFEK